MWRQVTVYLFLFFHFYLEDSIPPIITPASLPPIPFIEDEFDNYPVTEPADISTVTPKTKFYVGFGFKFFFLNENYFFDDLITFLATYCCIEWTILR